MPRKTFILFAAFALLAGATVSTFAQTPDSTRVTDRQPRSAAEKAQALSARMTRNLSLTTEQEAKVSRINLDKLQQLEALRDDADSYRQAKWSQRKAIMQAWNEELKTVLTPEQFDKYQQQQEEQRRQHRNR